MRWALKRFVPAFGDSTMRPAALVGLAALLSASYVRAADPTPYRAVVSDAEVTLRAGPSSTFPDTGTLPKGSVVVVEREEGNGWLAKSRRLRMAP